AGTDANVKWVAEQNLHWTLKFLGDVDSNLVPRICDCLADAVAVISPFDVQAVGVGAFPSAHRPRTVWLGIREGNEPFIQLHDALEEPLNELGFRTEHRRFQPHMTLGRVRSSPRGVGQLGSKIAEFASFDTGGMRVSEIILFSSLLDRHGPAYQVLGRAPLAGKL
ncbi:MAG: RNA 2',3'-cyclic phosphodiesterase, partial [Planctomycetota bacterium]|nr:RNA 2',3'-cyclic phosphodiesterase [Planctomycetota bacterium]